MQCHEFDNQPNENAIACDSCNSTIDTNPKETVSEKPDASESTTDDNIKQKHKNRKEKKKFTKKKAIILGSVSAVLITAILLIAFNFTAVLGFIIKNFCSDATYFKFVEKVSFDQYSVDIIEALDNYREVFNSDFCKDIKIKMHAEDEFLEKAEEYTEAEFGLSLGWLNDLLIDGTINVKDQKAQAELDILLQNKEMTDISYIKFFETGDQYLSFPCLTDNYLHTQAEPQKLHGASDLLNDPDIKKLIPSPKERKKILRRYLLLIIKEIDKSNVKGYDKNVTVNGTTEKLRVLEFTLDTNTANNIKKKVLTKLRDDKDIKKIIEDFAPVLKEKELVKNADTLYPDFIKGIDKELSQVEKYLKNPINEDLFTLVDYVNKKHVVVGRDVIVDGEKKYSFIKLSDSYTLSTNVDVDGHKITSNGKGTIKDDILSGNLTVNIDGEKYLAIALSDFNVRNAKNGDFKSKLTLVPTDKLLTKLPVSGFANIKAPKLNVNLDMNKDTAYIDIEILENNKEQFSFSVSTKSGTPYNVSKPADKYIIKEENKDDFFSSFKKVVLGSRIVKSGILSEISDWKLFVNSIEKFGAPKGLCLILRSIQPFLR